MVKEKPGSCHHPRSCPAACLVTVPTPSQLHLSTTRVRPSFGRKLQHFLFFERSGPTEWQHFLFPDKEGNTVAKNPCVHVCACVCSRMCVHVCACVSISPRSRNEPWTVKL